MRDAASGLSGRKLLLALLAVLVIAVGGGIVIPTVACRSGTLDLPEMGPVPSFTLTDERGQTFTEEALRGHPTIIGVIFTRCDTICPVITTKMARLQDKLLDRRAESIKLMSVSVDPEFDTPPVLAAYAEKFGARPDKWRFVTGPKQTIVDLVTGAFMSSMAREPDRDSGVPQIAHSSYLLLVDANLQIRGVYDTSEVTKIDELEHHARYLARTQQRAHKFGE